MDGGYVDLYQEYLVDFRKVVGQRAIRRFWKACAEKKKVEELKGVCDLHHTHGEDAMKRGQKGTEPMRWRGLRVELGRRHKS